MTAYDWPGGATGHRDDREGRRLYRASLRAAPSAELITPVSRTVKKSVAKAAPSANAELWAPIGPTSSRKGQPQDDGRVSGRVVDVAFEPTNGRRGYAASASGGVWFTDDQGSSWRSLGGWMPAPITATRSTVSPLSCGALMVEFPVANDPSKDVVWVGTGEKSIFDAGVPGRRLSGVGVLRGVGPSAKATTDNTAFTVEATNLASQGCFRLVTAPGGTIVVAGTAGLIERPAGNGPHPTWNPVAGHPMSAPPAPGTPQPLPCVDVLATPALGAIKARLWAVFLGAGGTLDLRSRDAGTATFTPVAFVAANGSALAPTGQAAIAAGRDGSLVWVLTDGPRLFRIDTAAATPQARQVNRTPPIWNGKTTSSKIAIAVDPTNPDRVAVGGTLQQGSSTEAGLYCGVVTKSGTIFSYPTIANSFCGDFVHPDVLAIRFSPDAQTVWVACDGGVYRSTASAANGTFVAKNDGLAVLECGFVASHPTHEGGVVAGLQDNGTQRRVGETVWVTVAGGDGGGLAFDPNASHRFVGQYIRSDWGRGTGSPRQPVQRNGHPSASYQVEEDACSFYSAPGVIARNATTQLAIGTNRVWYTENWGATWRTLPQGANTNQDARGSLVAINNALDVLPGAKKSIRTCRWETADRLWVITESSLFRYERAAGTWTSTQQAFNPLLSRRGKKGRTIGDTSTGGPGAKSGSWLDVAVHKPTTAAGKLGTLYLATSGDPSAADADQLFWFDGVSTWRSAGLRSVTTAAALAVAVEPGHDEFVYVGTTIGVFRGKLAMNGATPEWTWKRLDNGLPDVAVHDLSIFSDANVRVLRAATQARGVWELELGGAVTPRTYVRVHELDTRRRAQTPLAQPFAAASNYPWHASPDIRVHPRLAVLPPPASLPWTRTHFPGTAADPTGAWRLWQFQSALRAVDSRSEPNSSWPNRFDDVLRRAGAPLVAGKRTITAAFWNTIMTAANVAAQPWDAARPSEADLQEWLPTDIADSTLGDSASCLVPAGPATVQVVLHDRGLPATDPSQVRLALLRFQAAPGAAAAATTWAPGNVGWAAAITSFLNNGTAPALPAGWTLVPGGANAQPLDTIAAGSPQAVSLDTDFTGVPVGRRFLMVAVVWSQKDHATLTEMPLRNLTLTNHHVAVRSLRVIGA